MVKKPLNKTVVEEEERRRRRGGWRRACYSTLTQGTDTIVAHSLRFPQGSQSSTYASPRTLAINLAIAYSSTRVPHSQVTIASRPPKDATASRNNLLCLPALDPFPSCSLIKNFPVVCEKDLVYNLRWERAASGTSSGHASFDAVGMWWTRLGNLCLSGLLIDWKRGLFVTVLCARPRGWFSIVWCILRVM